jgi:hypothetical protein
MSLGYLSKKCICRAFVRGASLRRADLDPREAFFRVRLGSWILVNGQAFNLMMMILLGM